MKKTAHNLFFNYLSRKMIIIKFSLLAPVIVTIMANKKAHNNQTSQPAKNIKCLYHKHCCLVNESGQQLWKKNFLCYTIKTNLWDINFLHKMSCYKIKLINLVCKKNINWVYPPSSRFHIFLVFDLKRKITLQLPQKQRDSY